MPLLKEFCVSPVYSPATLFGGGWTPGSDPHSRGWRARWHGKVLVIGRRGVYDTFTAMTMSDGRWDVAFYLDIKPEVIAARIEEGADLSRFDPVYFQIRDYPGWGLTAFNKAKPFGLRL